MYIEHSQYKHLMLFSMASMIIHYHVCDSISIHIYTETIAKIYVVLINYHRLSVLLIDLFY